MEEKKILEDIARSTEKALIPKVDNILVLERKHKHIGVQGHEIIYTIKVSKKINADITEILTQDNSQAAGLEESPERKRVYREIAMAESSARDMDDILMSDAEFMDIIRGREWKKNSEYKRPSYASAMRKFLESLHLPMFIDDIGKMTNHRRRGRPSITTEATLEKAIGNKDLSQFLPEYLKRGVVEFLGTSIDCNYDRPGVYKVSVKFNITSEFHSINIGETNTITSNNPEIDAETVELTEEPIDFSAVYKPDKLSQLSSISQSIKSNQKPFLFTVESLEKIVQVGKEKKEKRLTLPPKILYDCNINGNFIDMGLFDFKGYWSIKSEGDIEMVILPIQNMDMLDEDTKTFLQRKYEHETGIMHYQNGLNISDMPILENSEATVLADDSPFAIIKIAKKYLREESKTSGAMAEYDIPEVLEMIEQSKTPRIEKRQLKEHILKLRSKESLIKEFPGTEKISHASYYTDMFKIDVNKDRIVTSNITPPREILKQYLGMEAYDKLGHGICIDDFVMRYHITNEAFDIALMPKSNLKLLETNTDSSGEFLEYFNNIFYTQIKAYGEPDKKICYISMPRFAKDSGIRLQFFANNDFYIRIRELDRIRIF
jgi:hypothetical protein